MGRVAVPKGGQKNPSPRLDASGTPVCLLAVPKTSHKPPLPCEGAPEVPVGKVAVSKTGQKNALPRDNLNSMGTTCFPCAREHSLSESSAVRCHRSS